LIPQVLLAALQAHLADRPDFDSYATGSIVHHEWLGKATALIKQWDQYQAMDFRINGNSLKSRAL
jgi:hypothetical protein